MKTFLDTNILVYALSNRPEDRDKQLIAATLVRRGGFTISTQVMQEFYVQATQPKHGREVPEEDVLDVLKSLLIGEIVVVTPTMIVEAILLRRNHRISYWDAAIVVAAKSAGCPVLVSEDLQHGQVIAGVRIENPFV